MQVWVCGLVNTTLQEDCCSKKPLSNAKTVILELKHGHDQFSNPRIAYMSFHFTEYALEMKKPAGLDFVFERKGGFVQGMQYLYGMFYIHRVHWDSYDKLLVHACHFHNILVFLAFFETLMRDDLLQCFYLLKVT